jgi:hypothetical protein
MALLVQNSLELRWYFALTPPSYLGLPSLRKVGEVDSVLLYLELGRERLRRCLKAEKGMEDFMCVHFRFSLKGP